MAFGLGSSRVIFTLVYLIVCSVLVLLRRDPSKDAELLVLRHENAAPAENSSTLVGADVRVGRMLYAMEAGGTFVRQGNAVAW
jgi:hypothetical protein